MVAQKDKLNKNAFYMESGISKRNIFLDEKNGADDCAPGFDRMLDRLAPGDVVYAGNIDDLGNGYDNILSNWRLILYDKKADIVLIGMPHFDTRRPEVDADYLTGLFTDVIGYLSDKRKKHNDAIQTGLREAIESGVPVGRPEVELPDSFEKYCLQYLAGNITVRDAAMLCNMSKSTFHRKAQEYAESHQK